MLIEGIQRRADVFIDDILWREEMLSIWPVKKMISAGIRKKVWIDRPKSWIVNKDFFKSSF
jgi:hypothetical protein